TPEELALVRRHPVDGAAILEPLRSIRGAIPMVRGHHERLDGSGYPDGLRGEAIALPVRVLAIADVFDSLASARPYRDALPLVPGLCLGRALVPLRPRGRKVGLLVLQVGPHFFDLRRSVFEATRLVVGPASLLVETGGLGGERCPQPVQVAGHTGAVARPLPL